MALSAMLKLITVMVVNGNDDFCWPARTGRYKVTDVVRFYRVVGGLTGYLCKLMVKAGSIKQHILANDRKNKNVQLR